MASPFLNKHSQPQIELAARHHLPSIWEAAVYFRDGGLTYDVGRDVPFWDAGSTGRRNTGVKSLCWRFKLQGLTWSFVELTSHFVQMDLRMHRQVSALWKVLSQQAIGILVRPALPRALRVAKIDIDVGRHSKAPMIRQFLAPVPGQGLI